MQRKNSNRNRIFKTGKALAAATLTALAFTGQAQGQEPAACEPSYQAGGYGALGDGVHPDSCWRPYAAGSPFNDRISRQADVVGGSTGTVDRLTGGGDVSYFVAGDSAKDWGVAMYYADSSDPVYTVRCLEPWGTCDLEGMSIHVPDEAAPSGVWPLPNPNADFDSHLTVVDQESGWEYDLWNIRSMAAGEIVIKWGGKTRIDGDGLGSDAVAARYGAAAGLIRAEELAEGKINHALSLTVPCTVGYVYPAQKGALECSDAGMSTQNALANGDLIQLKMRKRTIRSFGFPTWKEAILIAWKKYGAYVGDTTGDASQWSLKFESSAGYTTMGGSDPLVDLAQGEGLEPVDYNGNGQDEYWFNVARGVDWGSKLRLVTPGT